MDESILKFNQKSIRLESGQSAIILDSSGGLAGITMPTGSADSSEKKTMGMLFALVLACGLHTQSPAFNGLLAEFEEFAIDAVDNRTLN